MDNIEVRKILEILEDMYPLVTTALRYSSPFELLVSTILAAQCTDVRVNKVTSRLFRECDTPEAFLELGQDSLANAVRECGFYNSKSRNIIATCRKLVADYGSKVPESMEELVKLPGVGRKTANVVLSTAFGQDAIAVDTHVFRVSRRLGLASGKTPDEVEQELMAVLPKERWSSAHTELVWHGRRVCKARKPMCGVCRLRPHCNYGRSIGE